MKGFKLKRYEEAFTSENWIVRIYKVKPRNSRDGVIIRSRQLINFPEKLDEIKEKSEIFKTHKYRTKVLSPVVKKKKVKS